MKIVKIYKEDLQIAHAILMRDGQATREYMYLKCYPLFKSIYDNYYTDCASVVELINQIYVVIMTPGRETGHCQLQNYRGESTLATWLKAVTLFFCYNRYERKGRLPMTDTILDEENNDNTDRLIDMVSSEDIDLSEINRHDAERIIASMPNERYRTLIRLRYLENMTNEETAEALGMTMANYYNKHKLAKEQYAKACRKEEAYEY